MSGTSTKSAVLRASLVSALDADDVGEVLRLLKKSARGVRTRLNPRDGVKCFDAQKLPRDTTPLHLARSLNMQDMLMGIGADVRAQDHLGRTPLHYRAGDPGVNDKTIQNLLNNGADPNALDNSLVTPIHCAAEFSLSAKAVRALVMHGAAVNAAECQGMTALHFAARTGDMKVIRELVTQGADTTLKDSRGFTPLIVGLRGGLSAVEGLLQAGANPDTPDSEGRTALWHALRDWTAQANQGPLVNEDIICSLLTHGATTEDITAGRTSIKYLCEYVQMLPATEPETRGRQRRLKKAIAANLAFHAARRAASLAAAPARTAMRPRRAAKL